MVSHDTFQILFFWYQSLHNGHVKMRVALLHLQKQMTKLVLACGPLLATPRHKELKLFSICVVSDILAYYTFLPSCYSVSVLHQFIPGSHVANCSVLHTHEDTKMPPL